MHIIVRRMYTHRSFLVCNTINFVRYAVPRFEFGTTAFAWSALNVL